MCWSYSSRDHGGQIPEGMFRGGRGWYHFGAGYFYMSSIARHLSGGGEGIMIMLGAGE
jgi:hypothetical protein